MLFHRDTDPSPDDTSTESPRCSLPELYAFVDNFNKESKKSNLLKIYSISPSEAQKILSQKPNAMPVISGPNVREDPQPLFMGKVVRKEQESPEVMTEFLHCCLLTGSCLPIERLSKSQRRLTKYGIPPPSYTFPSEILTDPSSSLATTKKIQDTKLGISHVKPEKFIFEDRVSGYVLADPDKQFMDLRDLEWRYYKGIAKWKHNTTDSFINIPYNSEKRFVESQKMPDVIFPPLVHRSLVIYPRIDYPKNITPPS
ncbi:hypothetical protein mRhiFer1_001949 [Rhinolophus ferrumequinum]|uniref:Uncharacterized protein n=1 Tax=Rhinolophus ferrumequinum TaxID=59479 RepID=A0A7J7VPQ9_RHIFE|nr:uncharacterized protein C9orf153 homolog [Rhinolophus ferrumequinum]KAF6326991.1 hypothetical protein mRhiFer1_001949 [Rhinolophus ferrumequinum]